MCGTAFIPVDSSEVGYHSILPKVAEHGLVVLVAGKANDFSGIVDRVSVSEIASKSGHIGKDAAVPEEGVVEKVPLRPSYREIHGASHLTKVVKTSDKAIGASEVANVDHFAVVPKKRVYGRNAGGRIRNRIDGGLAGDLAKFVYKPGNAVGTSQRAQVMHLSVPQKGVRLCGYGKEVERDSLEDELLRESGSEGIGNRIQRSPNHLSQLIDSVRSANISTQCPKVDDFAILPKNGSRLREAGQRIGDTVFRESGDPPLEIDPTGE